MFLTVQTGLSMTMMVYSKIWKHMKRLFFFLMWITGSTSPALHLSSEERKRFFLEFALPFPLNYHVKWHKHPISAEQLSNSTGVLGEGETVQRGGGCREDCWQGDQAKVLRRSLLCWLVSFSYFLLHWALQGILQVWSIDHRWSWPLRELHNITGAATRRAVLNVSHGWVGLAFKQRRRSSTKALSLKTAPREKHSFFLSLRSGRSALKRFKAQTDLLEYVPESPWPCEGITQ